MSSKETAKKYYQKHKKEIQKKHNQYNRTHKKWFLNYHKKYRLERRLKLIKLLGDKCKKCSIKDWMVLEIEHIKGDGYKDREKFGTLGPKFYTYYLHHTIEAKKRLQILCANCHKIKTYNNGEWNKRKK